MPPSPGRFPFLPHRRSARTPDFPGKAAQRLQFLPYIHRKTSGTALPLLPPPALPYQRVLRSLPQPDPVRPAEGRVLALNLSHHINSNLSQRIPVHVDTSDRFCCRTCSKTCALLLLPGTLAAGAGAAPVRLKSSLTAGLLPPVLPPGSGTAAVPQSLQVLPVPVWFLTAEPDFLLLVGPPERLVPPEQWLSMGCMCRCAESFVLFLHHLPLPPSTVGFVTDMRRLDLFRLPRH